MISDIAMRHFDAFWNLIDRHWGSYGGVVFKIHAYKVYFPKEYADSLTPEIAQRRLFERMQEWGEIERQELNFEDHLYGKLNQRYEIPRPSGLDQRRVKSYWIFVYSFANLISRITYGSTIESQILIANSYRHQRELTREQLGAIYKLIALSNSFLLAEWFQDIIFKAIANDDNVIFERISKALSVDISEERLDNAKKWMAAMMLWYLGGKDIHPRYKLMEILQQKGILAEEMDPTSFNSMLSNIGLTKGQNKSK